MPKLTIGIKRLLEILGQDYGIEESTIWKMNPLVVAATIIEFKSAFLHA